MLYKDNLTFIDVFAGCGGLSLGLMQAGLTGLFAIEKDSNAFETLSHNLISGHSPYSFGWPEWLPSKAYSAEDVLEEHREDLVALKGKVDLLVGGPPCQGFSSAGRRDPSDPRNQLVEQYFQLVNTLSPKVVLIENVKGITVDFKDETSCSGTKNYAEWIIDRLSVDYVVHHKMIDTSEFGVPQKRIRLFIIALRKDLPESSVNPFHKLDEIRSKFLLNKKLGSLPVSSKSAISDLEVQRNGKVPSKDTIGFEEIAYIEPITSFQQMMNADRKKQPSDTRLARHKKVISDRFKKIIDICHAEGRLNVSLSAEFKATLGLKKNALRVLDPDSPSPTITSMPDDLIHYSEPRTLTVRENARLQSFPDWFEFKGKYTTGGHRRRLEVPRFTQVANAVPPLVAEAFGIMIKELFSNDSRPNSYPSSESTPASLESQEAFS